MSTVLVLQADPVLTDTWCMALESSGHAVLAEKTTAGSISRVREGGVDVVVVDSIGQESGLHSFVEELQRVPEPPPLLLISSSPDAPMISARIGAAAFLPKPCSPGDLDATVSRLAGMPPAVDDEPTRPIRIG